MSKEKILKRIEAIKAHIAKDRDELREAMGELEDICNDADEAVSAIETAVESLSRYL